MVDRGILSSQNEVSRFPRCTWLNEINREERGNAKAMSPSKPIYSIVIVVCTHKSQLLRKQTVVNGWQAIMRGTAIAWARECSLKEEGD